MSWSRDDERQIGRLTVPGWDDDSEFRLGHGLRDMLAGHAAMVLADTDLEATAEVGAVVELLNHRGFFYAGLRPCAIEAHDALRLQRVNALNLELEQVVCESEFARRTADGRARGSREGRADRGRKG